jgi:SAM-dependent methyltransferase
MNERILFGKCPLCDCPTLIDSVTGNCSNHPLYHNSLSAVMRWKKCTNCAHIFIEGYYTDDACRLIFSKTNEKQQVGFDVERQRITSSHMVEKALPYVTEGYWLDVGFGNGSLLFTAQEYGFVPLGVDLRIDNVNKMSSLGIECFCKDITELYLNYKCSVISMANVLEHMPYPKNALRAAYRLLSDEGVLLISMPNIESVVWKALDQNNENPYWGEMEHCHNFSRKRLYGLLREVGFEPVRYGISVRYRSCMEVIAKKI